MEISSIFRKISKEFKVLTGEAGKEKVYSSRQEYPDKGTAEKAFERSKEKLFEVRKWSDLPGITSAGFALFNAQGQPKPEGKLRTGDFLLIDLPGPDPETWVRVTDLQEGHDQAFFTVSPSPDPREAGEEEVREVEHFFADTATSTFKVALKGKTIYGYEIGKNEKINNNGKKAGNMGWINTLISEGGWIFFQEMQWEQLTDYLVHKIETGR